MTSPSTLPVILDCGSGYTKLGYGGNAEPTWVVPSIVAYDADMAFDFGLMSSSAMEPMGDFKMGDEASKSDRDRKSQNRHHLRKSASLEKIGII